MAAGSATLARTEPAGPATVGRPGAEIPAPRLFEPGGATLEELILDAWGDLLDGQSADCPLCGGRMAITDGCTGCGSELS